MLLMSDFDEKEFESQATLLEGKVGTIEPITLPLGLPKIGVRPGWKTSQGQLTALFTVFAMGLAALGYSNWTAEKMQNTYDAVMVVVTTLGPIIGMVWNLINYTNSRGKQASNSIWATAFINAPVEMPKLVPQLQDLKIPWDKIGKAGSTVLRTTTPGEALTTTTLESVTQKHDMADLSVESRVQNLEQTEEQIVRFLRERFPEG